MRSTPQSKRRWRTNSATVPTGSGPSPRGCARSVLGRRASRSGTTSEPRQQFALRKPEETVLVRPHLVQVHVSEPGLEIRRDGGKVAFRIGAAGDLLGGVFFGNHLRERLEVLGQRQFLCR